MDPLENAVWHTLVGDLAHLAELAPADDPRAARFDPSVSVFGAVGDEPDEQSWHALAELVGPNGAAVVFRADVTEPSGWTTMARLEGLQMLGDAAAGEPFDASEGMVELGPDDVPEVLELIARTEPGPFEVRTIEAGTYFGIRRDDRLVAMAGQRLRCAGRVEISAVCTDADQRGKGLARRVVGRGRRRDPRRGRRTVPAGRHGQRPGSAALRVDGLRDRPPRRRPRPPAPDPLT